MRLDKFLKLSRLIKRRTLAKQMCDQDRIVINDKPAKAGTQVMVGDTLSIRYGNKQVIVRVALLKETSRKDEAADMYEWISEQSLNQKMDDPS